MHWGALDAVGRHVSNESEVCLKFALARRAIRGFEVAARSKFSAELVYTWKSLIDLNAVRWKMGGVNMCRLHPILNNSLRWIVRRSTQIIRRGWGLLCVRLQKINIRLQKKFSSWQQQQQRSLNGTWGEKKWLCTCTRTQSRDWKRKRWHNRADLLVFWVRAWKSRATKITTASAVPCSNKTHIIGCVREKPRVNWI